MNLKEANAFAHHAAGLAYNIRSSEPDPAKWGPILASIPDEAVRGLVRTYLEQYYRSMITRARLENGGKKSPSGDAELAKIGDIARRL